ncbi:hypothetical protein BDQ12DRAFT_674826 [Crucibulum laeve]|uniref:BZIP domain-containing protein n=1 Tax=Crucibulum laeve TaxID=68775 RepID=A0A5C3MQ62_9AGAR|nr:hypothetical protein BDQ12DRAFT_674826 [Crucibulum laeve]
MPETKDSRERSISGDFDDSDFESHAGDGPNAPGKPGRKKNPNSQAARRDQNRIAQREFRLRKQQRIRDLEARVEILSGGKDEALGEMRNITKDLMAENQTLRNLLRSLASFIGDGAGGLLPKLGWDISDFNNFINKSETDTAWEGYQKRKKAQQSEPSSSSVPLPQGQKRASEDDASGSRAKKPRNADDKEPELGQNGYSMIVPMNASLSSGNGYTPSSRQQERNGMFTELMRGTGNGSPMFMQSPTTTTSSPYGTVGTPNMDYQPSYMSGVNMNIESTLQPIPFEGQNPGGSGQQRPLQPANQLSPEELEEDDDPNKNEAYKLIHYHLDNYKRNSSYCLPSSLRPSLVQRTVPHESVIDRILHPELRDRMILLRGRYDLVDCLIDYRHAINIHGDDVLAHSNWEIGEKFLRKYGFLIDQPTLNISNRWRRERGELELRLSDITTEQLTPA